MPQTRSTKPHSRNQPTNPATHEISGLTRCDWCLGDPLDERYHDAEWGVPQRNDQQLFEALTLEGAQAGLSWRTVLHKRENYRRLFVNFDPAMVAEFGEAEVRALLGDAGIIRHEGKIRSTISNAQAVLAVQRSEGSLAHFLWSFVDGSPLVNRWSAMRDLPSTSAQSTRMSRALKKAGFRFVGPTTCYALMQATGMVNDHLVHCFRHPLAAGQG